jgi:molybdopterin converting factor subunit 1
MTYRVRLFARLRELAGSDSIEVVLAAGSKVRDIRNAVARQYPTLADLIGRSAVAINDDYATDDNPISPADTIALIPPVSGG